MSACSELLFNRSLRSSPAQIEALAWSKRTGNFLTVDSLALRVWSTDRQLKACHRGNSDANAHTLMLRCFSAFALETADDAFVVIFSAKKKGQAAPSCVQVWSATLSLLHEVELSCPPLQFVALNPRKDSLQLVDVDSNIFAYNLTSTSFELTAHRAPSYSKGKSSTTKKGLTIIDPPTYYTYFSMVLAQLIVNDPENDEQVLGIAALEENKFVILDIRGIKIYSRNEVSFNTDTQILNQGKLPKRRKVEEIDSTNPFSISNSILIDFGGKIPCSLLCIRSVNNSFVMAFYDGTIRFMDYNEIDGANLLGEGKAHDCAPGNVECITLDLCQWQPTPGGFEFEVLTIGPDRKVTISGFRRNMSHLVGARTEGLSLPFETEILGSYHAQPEPPSHLARGNDKPARIGNAITYALSSSETCSSPCRRQFVFPVGGMLLFLNFHIPFRKIWRIPNELGSITFSGLAPSSNSFSLESGAGGKTVSNGSVLVLANGSVKIIDPASGVIHREFESLHLDETRDPGAVFDRVSSKNKFGHLGENNAVNSLTKFREGRATAAYWCSKSERLFLGYSTGGIGSIDLNPSFNSKVNTAHAETFKVHDSSIVQFLSFEQSMTAHRKTETKLFLLAGDEKGTLSLWKISRSNLSKTWSAEAHKGAVVSMKYFPSAKKSISPIVLTACSSGLVKAWVQNTDGALMLTSFFNASEPMSAFTSLIAVDNTFDFHTRENLSESYSFTPTESMLSTSVHSSSIMLQSSLIDSAMDSPKRYKTATLYSAIRVICVCGLMSGCVETWVLSSATSSLTAQWKEKNHNTPISCLCEVKSFAEMSNQNLVVMCASIGGSVTIFEMSQIGVKIRDVNYFSLPADVKYAMVLDSSQCMGPGSAIIIITEDSVVEIAPNAYCIAPSKYLKPSEVSSTTYQEEQENCPSNEFCDLGDSNIHDLEFSSSDYAPEVYETVGGTSLEISQEFQAHVDNQKQVGLEYQHVRKDREFIEVFLKSERDRNGLVSVQVAVDVIHRWLNAESIGQDAIWQLMRLLGVSENDKLQFIKVAKVAAIAMLAIKKKLQENSSFSGGSESRPWSNYRHLKKNRKSITYNSVGEPVHIESDFQSSVSDGLLRGDVLSLRAELRKLPSRAIPLTVPTKLTPSLLRKLPKKFSELVLKDAEIPKFWDPNMPHWLDLRRTVRVARTLLDMRTTKQHEMSLSLPGKRPVLKLQSLPKLLALYYERTFGSVRLMVSGHKIVHYLEACLQYVQWPIVGIMQRFMCPMNPIEEFSECSLWILAELRKMLFSRGCVVDGEVIPTINVMGDIEEKDDPNGLNLKWQLVSKSDALSSVNEMFGTRGNYGLACVQRLLAITRSLPSAHVTVVSPGVEYVDLEQFLYAIIAEFSIIEHFIAELDGIVFGLRSIPHHIMATSRDIVCDIMNKLPVDMAERDAKVSQSLAQIRALAEQFVYNDPLRTGTVDEITFRSIVVIAGDAILGFDCGRDAHKLVDMCLRRFRTENPGDDVCYLDFWATLLAYLHEFQGGKFGLTGTEALNALVAKIRGLDVKQASALTLLIEYMQCPQQNNFLWTTGQRLIDAEAKNSKTIAKRGNWKKNISVQQDLPGSLSAHEIRDAGGVKASIPPRLEIQDQVNAVPIAFLPETQRSLTTLSGEVFKPSKSITRLEEKVPLHLTDLSVGAFLQGDVEANAFSFADRSSHTVVSRRTSKASTTVQSVLDNGLGLFGSLEEDDSQFSEEGREVQDVLATSSLENLHRHHDQQGSTSRSPQNNKLIALEGMEKRRLQLLTEDQVLIQRQLKEAEEFKRRRELRDMHQKKSKSEHRSKEKVWMGFKEREDIVRSERKQRGVDLYEKALKAQRDDERKAASVAMEKLLEEKMRAKRIKAEREAKEQEERERVRELDERLLMKKEEHLSMEIEAAIAEKLRVEKEKAEKAAAEAERKAAEERERIRLEEEARMLQKAKEQALKDAAIALKEGLLMAQQDFNILLIPEPEPPISEPEPEPEPSFIEQEVLEEPTEAKDEDDHIIEAEPEDKSFLAIRMTNLVDKLKSANQRHFSHTRWSADNGYFMPQLFSHDITFQPFDSSAANQDQMLEKWEKSSIGSSRIIKAATISAQNDSVQSGSFDDISNSVRSHKLLLARQRLEQLYQTSSSEASAAEWTEVFRTAVVDWGAFFHEQQDILYERPTTAPPAVDEEAEFAAKMKQLTTEEPDSKNLAQTYNVPQSFLITYDQTQPEPLPTAKVSRGVVHPACCKYYHAEIVEAKAFVTIELKVERGVAELLVSDTELPTLTSYWKRAQAERFNKRIARISFTAEIARTYYIGVYSEQGAQFQTWIFSSGNPDMTTNSAIQQVSRSLREFDLLSNQPLEFLHVKLPALVEQAKRIVEFENKMAKPSILGDLQSAIDLGAYQPSSAEKDEELDEIEIMDRFISKAGRRLMRKDLREKEAALLTNGVLQLSIADPDQDEGDEESGTELNPNDHVELFPPPRLETRHSFLDLVNHDRKLQEKESTTFALSTLAQRNPLLSKSLDLKAKPKKFHATSSAKLPLISYTLGSRNQN